MMKLVYHTGLLIRLSEFESQCPYQCHYIEVHFDAYKIVDLITLNTVRDECISI
jgi:hypothetical protein